MQQVYYIIKSMLYFAFRMFSQQRLDVVFYYPQHFNKSKEGDIPFFKPLIESCKSNGLSYLLLEEPDANVSTPRNSQAVPFDFPWLLILVLRKLLPLFVKQKAQEREQQIGRILKKTILRSLHFNNYIVLSQSMLGVFRGLGPQAQLFELQHGIIHANKSAYVLGDSIAEAVEANQLKLLLSGKGYQTVLASANDYYSRSTTVIGSHELSVNKPHTHFNGNVLVSLQFTRDHSQELNDLMFQDLAAFLKQYANSTWTFYLKNHPRFNNEVPLDLLLQQENVQQAPILLSDCFDLCSMHVTSYSTTAFEAASLGIPSYFLLENGGHNYFQKDFQYPFSDKTFEEVIASFSKLQAPLKEWYARFYDSYSEKTFLATLKKV